MRYWVSKHAWPELMGVDIGAPAHVVELKELFFLLRSNKIGHAVVTEDEALILRTSNLRARLPETVETPAEFLARLRVYGALRDQ